MQDTCRLVPLGEIHWVGWSHAMQVKRRITNLKTRNLHLSLQERRDNHYRNPDLLAFN